MDLLQVRGLRAGYGKAEVLSGLDLRLPQGSVVTVIGPNGAGKSTTLNALMGVLPARGAITFDGRDIIDVPLEERVMAGLALVPEKRELFSTMTVEDNLVLGGWRQKRQMLAVGRALMSQPKVLMLDEPSLGLAPLIVREIFRIIERLRETGVSILLIEQNARAALEVADYGYVLETGAIALEGPARELAVDPRVIETYLGAKK